MTIAIKLVDLADARVQTAVVELLDHYSQHEMGSNAPLTDDVKQRLIAGLRAHPMSRVFIAYHVAHESAAHDRAANVPEQPVGIAVCFVGFSTFKAKPLINIHDLAILQGYRGQGIGSQLIDAVTNYARSLGCSAVTLEVRADNPARQLYHKKGFETLGEPLASDATLFGKLVLKN